MFSDRSAISPLKITQATFANLSPVKRSQKDPLSVVKNAVSVSGGSNHVSFQIYNRVSEEGP